MITLKETQVKKQEIKNENLLNKINKLINDILEENKKLQVNKEIFDYNSNLHFFSFHKTTITVENYLERIIEFSKVEESSLLIALIYLDRLCENTDVILNEFNVHRLLFTAIIVAIKYNEDKIHSNKFYSKVGGIDIKELNLLELEFIILMKYNLFIEEEFFNKYKRFNCLKIYNSIKYLFLNIFGLI